MTDPALEPGAPWRKTACILCSINCGLEVQTGGPDGRRILKVRGDEDHPSSRGYVCEKAARLDAYQNGADRLSAPQRRRPDGSYEAIDWDTAIREVAARLERVRARYGGEAILYYGGGGQGNHLGGAYGDATLKLLGVRYRSNALAQEKTGEFWVQGKMFGAGAHGDFERCEVAIFVGKNPWQSHGFPRARKLLGELQRDPARTLIVIDPRRSETARMADIHLAVRPGTDAWCLAALVAILVQEGLVDGSFLAAHTRGYEALAPAFERLEVGALAEVCGLEAQRLRHTARRIAAAKSVSVLEDLGVQMNVHSTLSSYLERLVWVLTGNYGREGTANAFVPFLSLSKASKGETTAGARRAPRGERLSPVTGARIITGLIPCNVIPEEILTDHPRRFRAMLIESGNPAHSLADSPRMREAIRALELSVVIDVAMTETARVADYVLPASSQYEKAEATFFPAEFPENVFHLRAPLFAPRPGTLPEAEIHCRLAEALGALGPRHHRPLRAARRLHPLAFGALLAAMQAASPRLQRALPLLLYRALGDALPAGMDSAAVVWGLCLLYLRSHPEAAARAGFGGPAPLAAERLFTALLRAPSGLVVARSTLEESWRAVAHPEHRIQLLIPELLAELETLPGSRPPRDPEFPLVLSAGERRSDTANTTVRDTAWHKRGRYGTLRVHPLDAAAIGCRDGDRARLLTRRGGAEVELEVTEHMQPGHVSLPNGQGLDVRDARGEPSRRGVAPNELTDHRARDPYAGTPWHKRVAARLEPLPR